MKREILMGPWLVLMILGSCRKSSSEKVDAELIPPQSADAQSLTYHKDIRPLMEAKCSGCHSAGGLAGLELTSYAPVQSLRNAIKAAVQSRRMPPWLAEAGHQVYRDDLSLSDAQIQTIVDWVDLGAEEGLASDYVPPAKAALFTPDATFPIFADGGTYLPDQSASDEYRCFVLPFDGRLGSQEFITGFTTLAGNKKIAHHLVAYTASQGIVPVLQELDASEDGRGYRCFGGALPDRLGDPAVQASLEAKYPGIMSRLNSETHWLAHWAPGMDDGYTFPEDTGIKVPAGGAFVIQMHYYTADAKGEADQNTRFALKLASTVKKPAFYFPLTQNTWLDSRRNRSMIIPAQSSATFSTEVTLAAVVGYGAQILNQPIGTVKNLEVHSANLHMHELGASGRVTMGVIGGPETTLLHVPAWDLHWQRDFPFIAPKVIAPADWSRTYQKVSCSYENPRTTEAYGGFGSLDEMCFNFGFFALDLGR